MKDTIVEMNNDYTSLEKMIPKLPSNLFGLIFKTLPAENKIEVILKLID